MNSDVKAEIDGLVQKHPVVLFMKGSRRSPACGFSAQVIGVLDELLPSYHTVNVLANPAIRQGIKEYSSWPTIPQLYIKGEFVGGCDIVKQMHAQGELSDALGVNPENPEPPTITVDEAAVAAFKAALPDAGEDVLRLDISAGFDFDLYVGPKEPGDVKANCESIELWVGKASCLRAAGLDIRFIENAAGGGGFQIKSPFEPPSVREIDAPTLAGMLQSSEAPKLFDVRTERERQIAKLEGAVMLDEAAQEAIMGMPKDTPIVFHCHHGMRSRNAANYFLDQGFTNVMNLSGGIEAWSLNVDPSVPRY